MSAATLIFIYRWDARHAETLLNILTPIFHGSQHAGIAAGYSTSWVRGPHVVVRLDCSSEHAERVLSAPIAQARKLAAERTKSHGIDPNEYKDLHRRLATFEAVSGALFPWYPDGTLNIETDREPADDGTHGAITKFDEATLELDLDLVRTGLDGGSISSYAFDLLVLVAHEFSSGSIRTGYVSFVSHSEAYLAPPSMSNTRNSWEDHFQHTADQLINRIQGLCDNNDEPGLGVSAFLGKLRETVESVDAKKILLESDEEAATRHRASSGTQDEWPESPFHSSLRENESWQTTTATSDWFAQYRLALNLTYLHLTKHGLTPHQRFMLCHHIGRSIETITGISSIELLETE